jgi:hypothetical protein
MLIMNNGKKNSSHSNIFFFENKIPVFNIPAGSTWVSTENPPRTLYYKPGRILPDCSVTGRAFAKFFNPVPPINLAPMACASATMACPPTGHKKGGSYASV